MCSSVKLGIEPVGADEDPVPFFNRQQPVIGLGLVARAQSPCHHVAAGVDGSLGSGVISPASTSS